tara:strand:+ start:345 stop:875 length:531 start_codon:yes stop_codon:yes gene_type:complete
MPESLTRRHLLARSTAAGFFMIAGQWAWLTPREAQARAFEPQVLSSGQCTALSILGDALVPGAATAGIAAYIDLQLQAGDQSLLIGKYLGVDASAQSGFYRAAADNVIAMTDENTSMPTFIADMAGDKLSDWIGPPASYVLFVLRADALDVTYGTPEGFENLGIPYMAHIMPEQPW